MSEFRADGRPGTEGGKKHDHSMHRCRPGITDTWNHLFIMHLHNIKSDGYLVIYTMINLGFSNLESYLHENVCQPKSLSRKFKSSAAL